MDARTVGLMIGGAVGAALATVVAYAATRTDADGYPTTRGENIDAWIASRRLRTPPNGGEGMRVVPILEPVRQTRFWITGRIPGGDGPDTYRAILDTLRGYARAADLDIDVRILWGLWTNETGPRGEGCKEFNAGSMHGDALIWCTPADARARRAYTTHPYLRGVYMGRDGGVLPFSAWSGFADFMRYQCTIFRGTYPEAFEALRAGGESQLPRFARGLVEGRHGPYMALAGLTVEQRIAHELATYRSLWTRRAGKAGVAWTR